MKILAIDIGTGTQDIFLYDPRLDIENGYKMVVPSPTLQVNRRLRQAARDGRSVVLTGCLMGGGPSTWGVDQLLKSGQTVYASPDAARSLNDDLAVVRQMGVTLVSDDEVAALPEQVQRITLRDFDFQAIARGFEQFGVPLDDLGAVAIGVFDHGNTPAGISDRQFRFDYLDRRIRTGNAAQTESALRNPADALSCFAFLREDIPPVMTRLMAVADSAAGVDAPLVVMDTAPAAVWGASFDEKIRQCRHNILVNIGNMHTLAFRLGPQGVEGLFEHHTGFLDAATLDALVRRLADGTIKHTDVFEQHGHGALMYTDYPLTDDLIVSVTGPRRGLMAGSALKPYFPAPFGDMMLAGCFGLLAAVGQLLPDWRAEIGRSLMNEPVQRAPWDLPL